MLLSKQTTDRIDEVFERAVKDDRRSLHEFEVYSILDALSVGVPKYAFIRDANEVDSQLIKRFQNGMFIKIVSRDIAHKSKIGGVRRIIDMDPLYIRFVLSNMKDEVLSHYKEPNIPKIDGFLIAEPISFTMSLGNEIMIGIKDDPSFGPVATLSKGGDDAEFFARYYDPANLILPPVEYEEVYNIVSSLKIRNKYESQKHYDYIELLSEALYRICKLAYQYSFISKHQPKYIIKTMDINPFVFSENGSLIAVDGFAEFRTVEECGITHSKPNVEGLKGFFDPKGIVVAGVSSDARKYSLARNIVQLLADMGRTDIYCTNPKGGEAVVNNRTYHLYRSLGEVPDRYDLVVWAAPAQYTLDFIATIPDSKSVVLISGLPGDIKYSDFISAINKHKERGLRFVGPNCMGVYYAPDARHEGIDTLFIGEERLKLGYNEHSNTALFSQSGGMAISSIERTQNSPIYKVIVSFGNKVDVNVPDLLRYFARDPLIDVIAMYIEGLGDGEGRGLFELARSYDKPILVYKAGRTEAGAKAAASHTAAITGSYDTFSFACAQAGIILIEELQDFYNCMKAFSMLSSKPPLGNKVAGIVNAGLDATMGADTLNFIEQAVLSDATRTKLKKINSHGLVDIETSFLDVTPMSDDRMFSEFVDAVLSDEGVDCVFIAIVPHIENIITTDEDCRKPGAIASRLIEISKKYDKPVVVSINSGNHYQGLVSYFEENGLPVFSDIRSAIKALDTFVSYHVKKRSS